MLYTFAGVSTYYEAYVSLLKAAIAAAVAFSLLISIDRLLRVAKYLKIIVRTRLSGIRPEDAFSARPLPDLLHGSDAYPRVAVQLPMFNERSVCQQCIASSCELIWPRDRFCVQVSRPYRCLHTESVCGLPGSAGVHVRLVQNVIPRWGSGRRVCADRLDRAWFCPWLCFVSRCDVAYHDRQ